VVAVNARVLVTGDIWGEDQVLLFSPALLSLFQPCYSLTFSQVQVLHRSTIEEACLRYPGNAVPIRRAYVRQVFRSAIRFIARKALHNEFEIDVDQKVEDKIQPHERRVSRRKSTDILTPIDEIIAAVQELNDEDPREFGGYGITDKKEEVVDLHAAHRDTTARFEELDAKLDAKFRSLEGMVEETLSQVRRSTGANGVGTESQSLKFRPSTHGSFRPIGLPPPSDGPHSLRNKGRDSGGVCINGCSIAE
jgi:hypothetical protein